MESILSFLNDNKVLTIVTLICVVSLIVFVIVKGISFETKNGNKIKIGGITKNGFDSNHDRKELKKYLDIDNIIKKSNNNLQKNIDNTSGGLIKDCIIYANELITKKIDLVKSEYKKLSSTLDPNMDKAKLDILNLLLAQAEEDIKTLLYQLIRKGHFSSKPIEEIEQIGESCVARIDTALDKSDIFDQDLIHALKTTYYKSVKNMSNDILSFSSKKYDLYKEYRREFINVAKETMKFELKSKLNLNIQEGDLEVFINYEE